MKLNIITPCSRPENLKLIEQSINIPKEFYRWIIVFDKPSIPTEYYIPSNCEIYSYQQKGSIVGHAQRNFALNMIKYGYIYFNDDDTILHNNLWNKISNLLNIYDFISFDQSNKDGSNRLKGSNIKINYIDSHNFIVKYTLCQNIRFHIDKYNADGYFATDCYRIAKNPIYIPETLSTYNALRS